MQPHSAALARSKSTWQRPTTLPDLRQAGLIALDSETKDLGLQAGLSPGSSTNNGCVVGISVAHRAGTETPGYYFPIAHPHSDNFPREQVAQWLRDHLKAGVRIVGCNLLYDLGWLSTDLGIPVPSAEQLEEVTAAATFTNENLFTYSLDALCQAYDVPGKDETLLREAITLQLGVKPGIRTNPPQAYIAQLPAQFVGPYAEQDAISTLRLHETLQPNLQREGTHKTYRTDVGLIPLVLAKQRRGIRIDVAAAERNRDLLLQKRNTIFAELSDKLGQPVSMEEIGRSKWLAEICDQRGVSYPRTAKGAPSFRRGPNGGWMHRCEDPIIRLIVTADVYNNAATNFIEHHILEHVVNGRLHPEIHPFRSEDSGTKSFRFSYSNPPLQQMPSHDPEIMQAIRSLFLPEDGEFWVSLDYAQQEFRLLTDAAARYGLTGALEAVARYKTDPTTDFHAMVAGMLGLSRPDAKTINFGIIYGMGVHKLAVSLGRTEDEAQAILERYHRELPFPHLLSDLMRLQVNRQGYLELCDGARRHYDLWHAPFAPQAEGAGPCDAEEARRRRNDSSHPWYGQMLRRVGSNAALNALIQGNAARQTKLWMLAVYRELGIVPLLQMHDALECSLSAPKQAERIAELGRDLIPLMLPMRIDSKVGRSWGGAKYSWDMAAEISPVVVESTVRLTPPLAERTDTGWSPAVALPVTSLDIATCTLDAELPLARRFAWIMAREKIRLRKESGASWPWTDNLIMQGIFCNAYREHDRVSRWVFDHILTPNRDDPDLWFAVATARLINEPDAVAAIGELVPFDPGRIQAALEARQARKERVLRSSAYRLPTPPTKGDSTIRFVVNDVLKPMWDNRETLRPRADDTLASFSARLEQCHQIGPFLAAQIIADVKRVQLLDASDRDSYVREGPGSGPGLNRMLGRTVTAAWSQGRFSATVLAVRSLFAPLLEAACLKLMDAQDIQHICCEFNKFEKAREAGKPLRRYKGAAVVAAKLPKPRKTKPATKQAPVTPTPAAAPDLSHLPAFMRGDVNLPSTAVLLAVTPSPPATAQTVEAPDLEEAARFLKLLDPAATQFTFQTFDDNKERKDPALVKMLHGTLAHCESRLTSLNAAGAGVFVTINETDLRGRKNKNITHVRRLFIDCDGAPLPQDEPRWQFAVESSKGHYHAYWRIDELALDAFTPAQELIIKRFGGDPVVKDLPRVMRLPGFWHLKDKPFRSRILEICDDSPLVQPADFETAEPTLQREEIST